MTFQAIVRSRNPGITAFMWNLSNKKASLITKTRKADFKISQNPI